MNSECTLSRQCFHGQRLELEAEVVQATVHCVLDNGPRQTIPEEIRVRYLRQRTNLDYQPYAPAGSLQLGKRHIVLVVWRESVVDATSTPTIAGLALAVAKIWFWYLSFPMLPGVNEV
jgi:DNA-binding LacI/PurR family transcriptional regulator